MGRDEGMNALTLDGDREDLRVWVQNAMQFGGSFVKCFAEASARADWENYLFIRPVLMVMMEKYPAYKKERFGRTE